MRVSVDGIIKNFANAFDFCLLALLIRYVSALKFCKIFNMFFRERKVLKKSLFLRKIFCRYLKFVYLCLCIQARLQGCLALNFRDFCNIYST